MSGQREFIVIDGNSFIHRAYHATKKAERKTSEGVATGAVHGVLLMVESMVCRFDEVPIFMVFDSEKESFRKTVYPEYKANRSTPPEDLVNQIHIIHDIFRAIGMPMLVVDGVEADDVIGTLAKDAIDNDHLLLICTGDKDMAQLVCDNVKLLDTMRDRLTDRSGVIERFGVAPEHIVDYLALVGDSADNIPGLPGVGGKTAAELINAVGGIDTMLADLDAVKRAPIRNSHSIAAGLAEHRALVKMSQFLATIKCDVELDVTLDGVEYAEPEMEALMAYADEYELYDSPLMRRFFDSP